LGDLTIEQVDADTVISGYTDAANSITLENVTSTDLGNDDFIFS